MKTLKKILSLFFFFILLLIASCVANENKSESRKKVKRAEQIIKGNLGYSATVGDSTKEALGKALDLLNEAIELDSTDTLAYLDKVTVLRNLNREVDSKMWIKILDLKPNFAEGYMELGFLYERRKNMDSAELSYRKARSIYLNKPISDLRNLNLIILEFLITNDKKGALNKLTEYPIQDSDLRKTAEEQILAIESGRLKK